MTSQLTSLRSWELASRYWHEFRTGLMRANRTLTEQWKRLSYLYRFNRSRRKATRNAETAFIDFIISTAANSASGKDLRWPLQNFSNQNRAQQLKMLPGFYLFVERYLFNALETSKQMFREVLYQQFRAAIDQHSTLKIIFMEPDQQKLAVYRRFLYSVAHKSLKSQRSAELGRELQLWLDGKNSFISFSKVSGRANQEQLIRVAHDFFQSLSDLSGERTALKTFHVAYEKQAIRYQNLECFHEILKLFPPAALDEEKYNLLSIQQMKSLLAEKVKTLEKVSTELHDKNSLLEKSYEELLTQSEQLNEQNHKLSEAQHLIQLMNDELASHSVTLETKIQERVREIAHKNELLVHYNNNLEQYTFAISHQLKAPIARILGLTNLLKVVPASEQPVIANSVHKSAKELNEIFKDLVHSLNFKKEVADLKTETIDVKELLLAAWEKATQTNGQKSTMQWNITDNATVQTDPQHLVNALKQVYDNALKFHKPGAQPQIRTEVRQLADRLEIEIQDQGLGFDAEDVKPRLFTPFQRFNQTHTGRGMGLYFTKQHLALLGGDVKITSEVNTGTKVKIELPIVL
jgi:signal transduction histidine kinase